MLNKNTSRTIRQHDRRSRSAFLYFNLALALAVVFVFAAFIFIFIFALWFYSVQPHLGASDEPNIRDKTHQTNEPRWNYSCSGQIHQSKHNNKTTDSSLPTSVHSFLQADGTPVLRTLPFPTGLSFSQARAKSCSIPLKPTFGIKLRRQMKQCLKR